MLEVASSSPAHKTLVNHKKSSLQILVLALVVTGNSDGLKDLLARDFNLWNPRQTALHRTP